MVKKYYGMYRGVVVGNTSDDIEIGDNYGRCKVWVPGIFPLRFKKDKGKLLPWAEPAFPIFGNDVSVTKGSGINSIPQLDTIVWVFFEEGDHRLPRFFGVAQGGLNGWTLEHEKQHTIKTEKVSVTFDDNPSDGSKNASLTIDITNEGDEALEMNITGNVKLNITGDVTEDITGNVSKTITGKYEVESTDNMKFVAPKIDLNP